MLRPRFVPTIYYVSCIAAACMVTAIAASPAAAADPAPYEARVVAAGASVQSGPGDKYYPTDTLAQGDVVEVYREKPGGWLAIRPPANSFSWVLSGDLKMRDGNLAEIARDDVASRIGSRLSEKHNAAQVRLKKGEVVEVLDKEVIGGETWYKISPPAGEFRWIQSALVERLGPIKTVSAETPIAPAGDAVAPPLIATPKPSDPPAAAAAAPAPASPPAATNATPITPVTPIATKSPAAAPAAGPVADDLSRELAGIELRLSRMVAAPVNLWNTERLERDANQLLAKAQTPADRDAVQVTLNKIHQFAVIGQRTSQLPATSIVQNAAGAGSGDPRTTLNNAQPPVTPMPGAVATTPAVSGGPYDAVGVLRPVVSRRPGAPQFALVDDRGQVLSFVTPTPDMNLQPYLGRRVGVVGNRGFIAEFNKTHVTAARITPLSDRVLR